MEGFDIEAQTHNTATRRLTLDDIDISPIHENDEDDQKWSVVYLRKEFKEKNLEKLFKVYLKKIQHGYYSLFLILQIILNLTHISVLLAVSMKYIDCLLPDILCYCVIAILSIIALFLKESVVKTYTVFPLIITIISIILLIFCDLFIPLYHAAYAILLRPAYTTHLIIACYVFLPISDNFQAFIFGFTVTLCHLLTLGFITYNESGNLSLKLASDAVYLTCINGLGLYFRFMDEILKRRTFLDRRACVETNLKLKYEKEQEEQLMLSILPQHIATQVRDDILKTLQERKTKTKNLKPFRNLYIQKHDNVTILFADIVNYTEMTRKLDVKILVETLNELFGKFDDASEKRDVLRIKFLGDCYYCVSGLPDPNVNHAKCCVELGFDMIGIIQKVRTKKDLNIDMRIGVHSGSLYSGLIGECKWQYDIWSTDVLIANHMEQTGEAGKVHITSQTKELLKGVYKCKKSNKCKEDNFLNRLNIEGYLLSPQLEIQEILYPRASAPIIYAKRNSISTNKIYARSQSQIHTIESEPVKSALSHRRTAFMDNRIKLLQIQIKEIENNLEEAIEKLPLRKFEQWFKSQGINPFFLTFSNLKLEFPYFVVPDPLFKYYLLSSIFVLLAIFLIQNLTLNIWTNKIWIMIITIGLVLFIMIPATWLYTLYKKIFSNKIQESNVFIRFIKYTAGLVNSSLLLRIVLYLTVSLLIAICTILDLVDCEYYIDENSNYCINPWHMSQTCCLAVVASFIFLHVPLGLKFLFGAIITITFSYFIQDFDDIFGGETWNPYFKPQIACIMSLTFLTFTLHLIDRQAEYLRRLDFKWKIQLASEQTEAQKMHKINNMLLSNILPIHVVEVYLSRTADNQEEVLSEPYTEEYNSVAVMFASVLPVDFDDTAEIGEVGDPDKTLITVMNSIISEFDMLLTKPCGAKVEKIKLAKWTYMAACGLDPGRKDSNTSIDHLSKDNIVVNMVRFAVNMIRVLEAIDSNDTSFQGGEGQFTLRIGISHGRVTAGVVGSKKPLYDIWGDTVNIASRMDTTGIEGKIQVTEHTASILRKQGIQCTYRDHTYVKGVGNIPTYFVDYESEESLKVIDGNDVT